jgi:hypothetical protein
MYLDEEAVTEDPFPEYQVPNWCDGNAAQKTKRSKLPRLFTFSCPRIHACHKKYDVQRRKGIEDLQREVPYVPSVLRRRGNEYVEVSRAEDDGIEDLGDERDAWVHVSVDQRWVI